MIKFNIILWLTVNKTARKKKNYPQTDQNRIYKITVNIILHGVRLAVM